MGKHALLLLLLLLLAAGVASCSSSDEEVLTYGAGPGALGMGELCIPTEEASPTFPGFSGGDVNATLFDPQCASGFCLAKDFQGRVTCPDGNPGPAECYTPAGDLVTVPVRPHALRTRPEDHVYCSCPCGGPPQLAPFCECPRGMKCELLFPYNYMLADQMSLWPDSYCVKQ